MTLTKIDPAHLALFTGTGEYHRFSPFFKNAYLTDGAKFLAEQAGAYWLTDVIGSYLPRLAAHGEEFAVASITKHKKGQGCIFRLTNGNDGKEAPLVKYAHQNIPFTDFPFADLGDEFKLYVQRGETPGGPAWVILLPSEY